MIKKLIFPSLVTLLLLGVHGYAEETPPEQTEASSEEHVKVGTRELDPATRKAMQRSRAEQYGEPETEETDAKSIFKRASCKMQEAESPFMLASAQVTSIKPMLTTAPFPTNCHWLVNIGDNGRSIEFEDGSHWEISAFESHVLRTWRREDSLVVTPNSSWLSSYDYYITNKSNNTFVKANLFVGPLAYGPYSHWVVNIDYFSGHVMLENQMIWCVNPQDSSILHHWAVNDHVIFGLNDSWFSPYDHILINVNMDNNIRVKQY